MSLSQLQAEYDKLHAKHGDPNYAPIYFGGRTDHPQICFVFMNPTARNIASHKSWTGQRAPWIGTKNTWKLFNSLDLIDPDLFAETQKRKSSDWDPIFADQVYTDISSRGSYLTNLAKCTQSDAKPLSDQVFREYLELFEREISIVQPTRIITFGNQVSSVFLGQQINVSKCRGTAFTKTIANQPFPVYPTYYPVGQGMRNLPLVISDLKKLI